MKINYLLENINYSNFTYRIEKLKPGVENKDTMFNGDRLRSLEQNEIQALVAQGNISSDWGAVRVSTDFIPQNIWHSHFIGKVFLGFFDGRLMDDRVGSGSLPTGIYRSTVENSQIASNCAIHNCPRIFGSLIVRDSLLSNSNTGLQLPEDGGILFGNGVKIPIGVETGGRDIAFYSDLSLELAEYVLQNPGDNEIQTIYREHLREYLTRIEFSWTIVDKHSRILDTKHIVNSYIGPYSRIQGADEIYNSSIFSTQADPTLVNNSSVLRNSILQDGVEISDAAIIQNSMLFEYSHATHHGKIVDSIIGPNSGVSKGEITSCFLGPFVGFHHQSLLIAAFWPGGRGNVGYGANVGSNHSSRMPDQECWPGEGMFFGLSCAIKYPANYIKAPYSIIAAGVTTLPQEIRFPFSLINDPVGYYLEVPPGLNNLVPAWCLYSNLYALKRNEAKYQIRDRAKRNRFDLRLFRPKILSYMREASHLLKNISERKTIYLPGDIPGIGKNMLTDENRLRGIEAYDFFLRFIEYQQLKERVSQSDSWDREELPELLAGMEEYLSMLPAILTWTESSREKDMARGSAIFPDYQLTHPSMDEDSFVIQVREETAREQRETENLIASLYASLTPSLSPSLHPSSE